MSIPADQPAASPSPSAPTGRRFWRVLIRAGLVALVLAVAFIAAAPYLLSQAGLRAWLLPMFMPGMHGSIAIDELDLGWFRPVSAAGVTIKPNDAPKVLTISSIQGDRPLWKMLFTRDLGMFHVVQPALLVELSPSGSNVARLAPGHPGKHPLPAGTAVGLEIVDGRVSVHSPESGEPWGVDHLNLNVVLRPAASSKFGIPELVGEHLVLLDHMALTRAMCNDVLKYIAPVLARTARTQGEVSLRLDQVDWPLGHPELATLSGVMVLHEVDVGPSPFAGELFQFVPKLKAPTAVKLVSESEIKFNMHNGRVYHDGLAFGLPETRPELIIRSHGSVGLDESLDLMVEIPLVADLLGHGPLRDALSKETLTLHFGGTLSHPKLERDPNDPGFAKALGGTLSELFKKTEERGSAEGTAAIDELLKALERRRQSRTVKPAPLDKESPPLSPPQRPLRKLLRRIEDAIKTPPPPAEGSTGNEEPPSGDDKRPAEPESMPAERNP